LIFDLLSLSPPGPTHRFTLALAQKKKYKLPRAQTAAAIASSSVTPSGQGALVLAEHSSGQLSPATLSAVAAASQLLSSAAAASSSSSSSPASSRPHPITVLVAGDDAAGVASAAAAAASSVAAMLSSSANPAAAASASSSRILTAIHPRLGHGLAEGLAQLVADLCGAGSSSSGSNGGGSGGGNAPFAAVAAPGSTFGRNVLPRAAALASRDMVSDVVAVDPGNFGTLTRPVYAGAALETVAFGDGGARFFTARPSAFPVAAPDASASSSSPPLPVEALPASEVEAAVSAASPAASWLGDSGGGSGGGGGSPDRPDLGAARVVVAGGRALADAAGFASIGSLADAFGPGVAAVGASRAAVDAGLAPNELQVGQTGRSVAPELYVAVGISGAAQHVAGMRASKCIVAINTDGDSPIFSVADYGLVGDWREALPKLEEAVRARRGGAK
jgi:electron transfer flavoprotein alpha subunit